MDGTDEQQQDWRGFRFVALTYKSQGHSHGVKMGGAKAPQNSPTVGGGRAPHSTAGERPSNAAPRNRQRRFRVKEIINYFYREPTTNARASGARRLLASVLQAASPRRTRAQTGQSSGHADAALVQGPQLSNQN